MKNIKKWHDTIIIGMLVLSLFIMSYNIYAVNNALNIKQQNNSIIGNIISTQPKIIDVRPKGIPPIYGAELNVNFDDISSTDSQKVNLIINKIGSLENNIVLTASEKNRYIKIVSLISCEYCCGAESIIFSNGDPACGCSHSAAMRGIAKYLIKYHSNDYSDDQILEELGKWKTLFFPTAIGAKAVILKEKGIEINYINLASNKYRGIETSITSASGMVGGC